MNLLSSASGAVSVSAPHPLNTAASLQRPPRYDHWPVALRSAMRLRGAVVPCGPGLRGVAWPDSPSVRLSALQPWLTGMLMASHLTAAWVWGAARQPSGQLTLAAPAGQHSRRRSTPQLRFFELRIAAADIISFCGLKVTSRRRTLLDLLHSPAQFGCVESTACHLLLRHVPGGATEIARQLEVHRRPHALLARQRLHAMS